MEADEDLREAIEECAKVVEERCKKRPYMIIVAKADVGFRSDDDKEKGKLSGKTSYLYLAKPTIKHDGLSRLLVDSCRMALDMADEKVTGQKGKTGNK